MSHPQNPSRTAFHFRNPLGILMPKGSYMSSKHLSLVNTFEESLKGRMEKLNPSREAILRLPWMGCAMEQLCGVHTDFKILIEALNLSEGDWQDRWAERYFDNSEKLLDICNNFTSLMCELEQSHIYLLNALDKLGAINSETYHLARSSLDMWKQRVASKSPTLDRCFSVIDGLFQTRDMPKAKSGKGKALMRAMHGVKVVTLFVCNVFVASFSGSTKTLMDLNVPDTYLWAEAFVAMQGSVNNEITSLSSSENIILFKEVRALNAGVKKLDPAPRERMDHVVNVTSELRMLSEEFSQGLLLLSKEIDNLFRVLMLQKNALTHNKLSVTSSGRRESHR